jgi:hypothetical protein
VSHCVRELKAEDSFLQRCLQEDFYGHLDMQKLKSNRTCLEEISLCSRGALSKILSRLGKTQSSTLECIHDGYLGTPLQKFNE